MTMSNINRDIFAVKIKVTPACGRDLYSRLHLIGPIALRFRQYGYALFRSFKCDELVGFGTIMRLRGMRMTPNFFTLAYTIIPALHRKEHSTQGLLSQ